MDSLIQWREVAGANVQVLLKPEHAWPQHGDYAVRLPVDIG